MRILFITQRLLQQLTLCKLFATDINKPNMSMTEIYLLYLCGSSLSWLQISPQSNLPYATIIYSWYSNPQAWKDFLTCSRRFSIASWTLSYAATILLSNSFWSLLVLKMLYTSSPNCIIYVCGMEVFPKV